MNPRRANLRPRKPIAKKRRQPAEFARIYHSRERVQWVKSLACIACGAASPIFDLVTAGSSHNAHTVTGGTGRKAGYETIIPLCASHHRRYDEHKAPFDTPAVRQAMKDAAATVESMWQDRQRVSA